MIVLPYPIGRNSGNSIDPSKANGHAACFDGYCNLYATRCLTLGVFLVIYLMDKIR